MDILFYPRNERVCLIRESYTAGSILESKGMHGIFQKKGKEMFKKSKMFENLGIALIVFPSFAKSICSFPYVLFQTLFTGQKVN